MTKATPEVGTEQREPEGRCCRGDCDAAAASWETGRIPGGPHGAAANDSMTVSVPRAGCGRVGALPPGFEAFLLAYF